MAERNGVPLKLEYVHEAIIRILDENEGCFLSGIHALLGENGVRINKKELVYAIKKAEGTKRLVFDFRFNKAHLDLFIMAKHFPGGSIHQHCGSIVCNNCYPAEFIA